MKQLVVLLSLCVWLALGVQARSTTLPDACGDDKVQFNVKTEKNHPAPKPPDAGKAQVVFIDAFEKDACQGCGTPTSRIGVDGAWVGAAKGDSYFAIDVTPGEHHLCADWQSMSGRFRASKVALSSFSAEAGKVYYFEASFKSTPGAVYGMPNGPVTSTPILSLDLKQLSDDEGRYRVKVSALATATQKK